MDKLILVGGGGHAKSCIDVIERENKFQISGILDVKEKIGQKILGYEIIGTDDDIPDLIKKGYSFFITLGQIDNAELRKKIFDKIKSLNGKLAIIISPDAYVSKHAEISEGTIIMNNAIVNADAKIGANCIINTNSLIEHECIIEDNCHISIGATIAGQVYIGQESFIGANSTIVQGVKIPEKSFIKAGSLIKQK